MLFAKSEGCGRVREATCGVRARAKGPRNRLHRGEERIEERKVRAGVSKRVAKCNLKKERTSSPTTTLSSPLTTAHLRRPILGQRPGRRRRKVQSGLQFSPHTANRPCLPSFLSRHHHLLFSSSSTSVLTLVAVLV